MGVKQVIVVRKDLNMRKGKIAAQVAHASMMFLLREFEAAKGVSTIVGEFAEVKIDISVQHWAWLYGNYRKIVAYVDSHEELCDLQDKAADAGIAIYPIIDAGLTEFKEPTLTCCAFGPDDDEKLDAVTGHLKLL